MNVFALAYAAVFFLFTVEGVGAEGNADAILTHRALPLIRKLQVDLSNVPTFSPADLTGLKDRPITGSVGSGLNTYLRYGYVQFVERQGGGTDISGGFNSASIMRPNSLYLSLTVVPRSVALYANRSYDLAPYLRGCRLYVFYRENLIGHVYPDDSESTSTQRRIDRVVTADLQKFGIKQDNS